MKKQKICIVGGGLTGLVTAITLSKLNVNIDLVIGNINKNGEDSNRTTAISQSNYDFLRKLDIFKYPQKKFWPCTNMKLYTFTKKEKFIEIFAINKIQKQILYVIDNSTMIKQMIRYIKKNKLITCKTQKKVPEITTSSFLKSIKFDNQNNSKYNLIIFCTGNRSNLSKIIFDTQTFNHSYGEVSITTIVKHSYVKNNTARQIFLHNEILALLPVTNTKTSIVWSVKKNVAEKYKKKKNYF